MSSFEIMQAPSTGAHLIDASAGTGKTYTISGLVVRMIVEYEWSIEEILVVTFTEAAAVDLKSRIRKMILETGEAFAEGKSKDHFISALVGATGDHPRAMRLLHVALQNFDEAPIFTIHGFCQRVLTDNFLECGLLLDSELITDQMRIIKEIAEDFFRKRFYDASPLFAEYCLNRLLPDQLRRFLGVYYARDDIRIIPVFDWEQLGREIAIVEDDFTRKFTAMISEWPQAKTEVARIFLSDEGLNRRSYSLKSIPGWFTALDRMAAIGVPDLGLFEDFHKFTPATLNSSVKKGFSAPGHDFFVLCEELLHARDAVVALFEMKIISCKGDLFAYVRNELAGRKEQGGYHSFDDMLSGLFGALRGRGGAQLAAAVRTGYRAALIDEFQDTDPVQYEIFRTIFSRPDSLLLLIGDPKQAIYSFRGADIFAYIKAVKEVGSRFTLGHNWRSVPGLIAATNTLFSNRDLPFLFEEILFEGARAAEKEHKPLLIDGKDEVPFHLLVLERLGDDKPDKLLGKEVARNRILAWLVGEITRLLSLGREGRATIGGASLGAGDIAVLVRTNNEARQTQKALAEAGVASVLHSSESLFVSREAEELLLLLRALAEPGDSRILRAALATRIIGLGGHELDILNDGGEEMSAWIEKFRDYHDNWLAHGFGRMFSHFLTREKVRSRLLRFSGGERVVTNLLHLHEILHLAAGDRRLGITGLCKYLAEAVADTDQGVPEEYQLRLESDAELVQIVTIHKAKGLQYPVVFCPYSWEGSRLPELKNGKLPARSNPLVYHDRAQDFELIMDLGSSGISAGRNAAVTEELAENLRLLYVALTRAAQRCYLFWGPFSGAGSSALAYLLHHGRTEVVADCSPDSFDILAALDDDRIKDDIMALLSASGGNIGLRSLDEKRKVPLKSGPRDDFRGEWSRFSGRIDSGWTVPSFSSLAHKLHGQAKARAFPPAESGRDKDGPGFFRDIKNFPKGSGPGTFLHTLLENLDFKTADRAANEALIRKSLVAGGYDSEWFQAIQTMLANVLNAVLPGRRRDILLADIDRKDRLDELEFYFPLKDLQLKALAGLLSEDYGIQIADRILSQEGLGDRVRGFMKGYIDLIFYHDGMFHIVDWKSNHLGYGSEDYSQPVLHEVMTREMYILQYLIYAVALHRYLGQRMADYAYEKHFGGVYYLFLRGMECGSKNRSGIYHEIPSEKMVLKVAEVLSAWQ